jgi:formate hydrogenlyase transcriptional activator
VLGESDTTEARYRALYNDTPVMLHSVDPEGRLVAVNDHWLKVMEYTREEVLGRFIADFHTEESGRRVIEGFARLKAGELRRDIEYQLVKRGGEVIDVLLSATVERDDEGRMVRSLAALTDITAWKRAEEEVRRLRLERGYLREEIATAHNPSELIGPSSAMSRLLQLITTVAPSDSTVLITGETGTGKELVARAVHRASRRREAALIAVNCAALSAGLIESELFGHEKGAFTGAITRKVGRFELADKGTILLDEVGELSLEVQAKLLRVLQEGEFERVGSAKPIGVDTRVIAATNRDLAKEVAEGRFRADLFYRLNVFPIQLPPLRERREDIPLLAEYFAAKYAAQVGKPIESISPCALAALTAYRWPGNVRELQNVIERAVLLNRGTDLELGDWFCPPTDSPDAASVATLADLQRAHITKVLELTGWRVSGEGGAARILGLKPTTLHARMAKLRIHRSGGSGRSVSS